MSYEQDWADFDVYCEWIMDAFANGFISKRDKVRAYMRLGSVIRLYAKNVIEPP